MFRLTDKTTLLHPKQTAGLLAGLLVVASVLMGSISEASAASIYAEPTDFAVYALGNATVQNDVEIQGNIAGAGDTFDIGHRVFIDGNAYADANTAVFQNNGIVTGDIVNSGGVYIGDRVPSQYPDAGVRGSIHSQGSVKIEGHAVVAGNVHGSSVWQDWHSNIEGNVYFESGFSPRPHDGSSLGGQAYRQGQAGYVGPDTISGFGTREAPSFNGGSQNVTLSWNETADLAAGSYDTLTLKSGATLRLTAGTYTFGSDSLVEWNSQFIVDSSLGDVIIQFADGADIYSNFTLIDENESDENGVLVLSGGRLSFGERTSIDGSIYTFGEGDLTFGNNTFLDGQVYTEGDFFLGEGSVVTGRSVGGSISTVPSPAAVSVGIFLVFSGLMKRQRRQAA